MREGRRAAQAGRVRDLLEPLAGPAVALAARLEARIEYLRVDVVREEADALRRGLDGLNAAAMAAAASWLIVGSWDWIREDGRLRSELAILVFTNPGHKTEEEIFEPLSRRSLFSVSASVLTACLLTP